MNFSLLKKFSTFTLFYTLAVILWGAWVRISGSGAGCGKSWPLCDGQVIPAEVTTHLKIEWFHRFTSFFLLVCVVSLFIYCFKKLDKNHIIRKFSFLALILVFVEALIGAGLVLFELTGSNSSPERAFMMSFHLLNTFFFLACLVAVSYFAKRKSNFKIQMPEKKFYFFTLLALFLSLSATGALASLVNNLYPSLTFMQGLKQDLAGGSSHWLIKLRWLHPLLAFGIGSVMIGICTYLMLQFKKHKGIFIGLLVFILIQWTLGFSNLIHKGSFLKLGHLFTAYMIWIHIVLLFLKFFFKSEEKT